MFVPSGRDHDSQKQLYLFLGAPRYLTKCTKYETVLGILILRNLILLDIGKFANELVERQCIIVLRALERCLRVKDVAEVRIHAVFCRPKVRAETYFATILVDELVIRTDPIVAIAFRKREALFLPVDIFESLAHKARDLPIFAIAMRGIWPTACVERVEFPRRLLPRRLRRHFHLGLNCESARLADLRNRHTEIANCNYV